jgi:thiamine biosynthesis lipoprotein
MATTPAGMTAASRFRSIGTTCQILATDPAALPPALVIAREQLEDLDRAASRFRADSEVCRLAELARTATVIAPVSAVLADYLGAALDMARLTDGLVDPTVGSAVVAAGYDADLDEIRARTAYAPTAAHAVTVPGWRSVTLDTANLQVRLPAGCLIDVGSTAKAHAADRIAALLAARLPGGFLVNLGGDIAVAGPPPSAGWQVGVEDAAGDIPQVVATHEQAIATSSTRLRTWAVADGTIRHHIVDPRAGRTAPDTWAQVSCSAASALEANAASTAAIVLGPEAPAWLEARGIPARLDGADGRIVLVGGWPEPVIDTDEGLVR